MVVTRQGIFRSFFGCILSCLLCAMWCINLLAQPVTPEMAQKVAANWIRQKTGVQKKVLASFAGLSEVKKPSSLPDSYTVNMEGGGWVIVAGDDVAYPIIGYALQGSVNPKKMPPAFRAWVDGVQQEIRGATKKNHIMLAGNTIVAKNNAAWDMLQDLQDVSPLAVVEEVQPLLKTTWSQGKYYNTSCPADANSHIDGHAYVGCVATAMGQVMKYHSWPDRGVGQQSYNHATYGTLSANFGETDYAWRSMPSYGSLTDYNPAVATLLYHAGVSVYMNYGIYSSSASTWGVAWALKTHFKYKDTAGYERRSSYTTQEWEEKIKAELNVKRPVIYRGNGSGGHAFVCDGYSGNEMFHFNWGWNGAHDGYFNISDLTPGAHNYNNNQGAVFGIDPDGKPEQKPIITPILSLLLNPEKDDRYEDNDTKDTAYYPGYNWENKPLSNVNGLGIQKDFDYYKIFVTEGYERVKARLEFFHAQGDLTLMLLGPNGLLTGSVSSTDNEEIDFEVADGDTWYYLLVLGPGLGTTYDLWWDDLAP